MPWIGKDLKNNLKFANLIPAEQLSTTETGTGVDMKPHQLAAAVVLSVGAITGTDTPTAAVKIQDSADNSTFADLSGATFTALTAVGGEVINITGFRRYIRAVATLTGTSPVFDLACVALASSQDQPAG